MQSKVGPAEDYSQSFMKMIKRGIDSTNWPLKKKIWLKIQIVGEWKGLSKLFWMEASIRGPCQLCCWESCWSLRPFFLFHQRCTHIWKCNFFFWKKEEEKLSTPCNRFYVPDSSNYPQGNVFSRPHKLAVLFFKEEELVREVKRSSNDNQLIIHWQFATWWGGVCLESLWKKYISNLTESFQIVQSNRKPDQ